MALPILKIMLFKFIAQNDRITGYDFLKYCKEKGISASSGSVYPHLKEFVRKGLIEKSVSGRKNYYSLTEEGRKYFEQINSYKKGVQNIFNKMGVVFENNFSDAPDELREKFNLLYYKVHSTKYNNKKSLKELLSIIQDIEKLLRRHIDGKGN